MCQNISEFEKHQWPDTSVRCRTTSSSPLRRLHAVHSYTATSEWVHIFKCKHPDSSRKSRRVSGTCESAYLLAAIRGWRGGNRSMASFSLPDVPRRAIVMTYHSRCHWKKTVPRTKSLIKGRYEETHSLSKTWRLKYASRATHLIL
jgi:hypothetical protein